MFAEKAQCQRIARLLCQASEQVLWEYSRTWLEAQPGQHRLHCRVGHGEATYYRTAGINDHILTYGWKMVASKRDEKAARRWRTGREIVSRGYFGGDITLPALLAHTCCHEFAHLVQSIRGWIARGSIHNAQFYRVLDRIHASGAADRVLDYLLQQARAEDIVLAFRPARTLPAGAVGPAFRIGQMVSFSYKGGPIEGEVIRVNRNTVNVRPIRPYLGDTYFRVSPQFLKAIA